MAHGPTDVMRDEHRRIRRCLDEAATALDAQDDAKFTSSVRAMKAVLVEHNMKEEHVLYPATDDGLSSDRDRDDLVRQMQAM
jgi:hemerythrin superfamily protein